MIVLIIGTFSAVYVNVNQAEQEVNSDTIKINNQTFQIQSLFNTIENVTIQTDDGNKTGIALSEIIKLFSLNCPSCHSYVLKSSDGYQQTVDWNDMQKGILSIEKRSYFPHIAHAFWVKDITQIEVKE